MQALLNIPSTMQAAFIAVLLTSLTTAPIFAYTLETSDSPETLATVTLSGNALLMHAAAAIGSTVFGGDTLQTGPGGVLVVRSGEAQLYLREDTDAEFEKSSVGIASIRLTRGSAGFSSGAKELAQIDLPDATVRSRSSIPAHGMVTLVKPGEFIITSIHGDFDVTVDGITHTIADGKSYRAVIQDVSTPLGPHRTVRPPDHPELRLFLIVATAGSVAGWY